MIFLLSYYAGPLARFFELVGRCFLDSGSLRAVLGCKDAGNRCSTKSSFSGRGTSTGREQEGRSPKSINIRRGKLQAETLMDPARVVGAVHRALMVGGDVGG